MSFWVAGSAAGGGVRIRGSESVRSSYPRFFDDMGRLGA